MIVKTNGIVLSAVKYKETSIIAQIYTADFGQQGYIVQGARGTTKGRGGKMALYQPLTFLELVAYHKENRAVQRVNEAKMLCWFQSIPFDFKKSTIALFLSEVLNKALREEAPNEALFSFLLDSFVYLDGAPEGEVVNFHLQFLLQLSDFLGFGVSTGEEWLNQLGLRGVASHVPAIVTALINGDYGAPVAMQGRLRSELLYWLVRFYQQHLGGFGEVKSLSVLQALWHD